MLLILLVLLPISFIILKVAVNCRITISVQVKSVGGSPTLQTRYVVPSASTQYINP